MKILMVCLGNICRSPLAEGIMRTKLPQNFTIDSAGTMDMHQGNPPDFRSVSVAKKHGIKIDHQLSRPILQSDLDDFDYIFCMDGNNEYDVLSLAKNDAQKSKVKRILYEGKDVPDPYFGDEYDFEEVFQLLDQACTLRAQEILNKN
ncbi:MAG: low molecular weight phosphotyrosine protein phosphatase [Bacteroidetes bacterium]|nr:low molecular weight phosphotyrosine protein phosphatase [Bacteroidota bacterium]